MAQLGEGKDEVLALEFAELLERRPDAGGELRAQRPTHPRRADEAEEPDPVPPPNRPDPAALRERAKNISPDERQKLTREFREKHGLMGTNQSAWEKRREELKKLPPAERAAKLKELRQEVQEGRGKFKLLSAEDRDVKQSEMKTRIDVQIAELQKRKTEGGLTESEQRRLERMQQMSKRLGRPPGTKPKTDVPRKSEGELPPPSPK